MRRSADPSGFRRWHEVGDNEAPPADVRIVTSDGRSIPAHYSILASASPVLDRLLNRAHKSGNSEWIIHILGVRHGAALAFVQFLYSSSRSVLASREAEAALEEHGMALLALAHAYRVQWLKRGCEAGVAARLTTTNVVDVLKLARMCDAPSLRQRCMKLVAKDFTDVQRSEGWRFAQQHDTRLEMEILRFLEEADQRRKRWRRERVNQEIYRMLSEAMECLKHIFAEGKKAPCTSSQTCQRLQLLIHHYATCDKKFAPGGCTACKKTRDLFRLHSSLCDQSEPCKVPLCKHFKMKMQKDEKVDPIWRLLVKKVVTAKVMATLANRKTPELVQKSWIKYASTRRLQQP